jgi:glycosyltransferase involved in cell wall biosynthesis
MIDNPLFSVIIPTYNRAEKLRQALASVEQQGFPRLEVVVADDGSTDHTPRVVENFSGRLAIHYVWQENWGGPARPTNNALKLARAEWICFLNSDDWWYPEKLETILPFIEGSDILFHDLDIYDETGRQKLGRMKGRSLRRDVFGDLLLNGSRIFSSSAVIRKTCLDRTGGMSEDRALIAVEDLDLWLRLSKITSRFRYIPRSLGAYRDSADSLSIGHTETASKTHKIYDVGKVYDLHVKDLPDMQRRKAQGFLDYSAARSLQKMGFARDASESFKKAMKAGNQRAVVKSMLFLLLNLLKSSARGRT